jgi:sugar lactone lactonase YvrE
VTALQTIAVEVLDATRCHVGECPLWNPAERSLWWVDIEGRALHRHHLPSGKSGRWSCAQRLACIAPMAHGGLLGAMEDGLFHLRPQSDGEMQAERLTGVEHAHDGMRFNDGRCDRHGRFWVSSMVQDMSLAAPDGALYRFDATGLSAPLLRGLITGNGLALSPAGDRLYLSDSHPSVQRIWAFDLRDDGSLGARREFVDMNAYPGRPDGAAVDADGGYWTCANDAGVLLRFTPEGRLDRALRLPVSKPSMCAFGGALLDELFVTSIIPARPAAGFDAALDGAVLVLRPGVRGLAETPFEAMAVRA